MANNALTPLQIQMLNESTKNEPLTPQQKKEIDDGLKAIGLYGKTGLSDAQVAQIKNIIDQATQATSKLNEVNFMPTKAETPKAPAANNKIDWGTLAGYGQDLAA